MTMTKNDEEKDNISIDDIEFVDAVFGIPKNAVEVVLNVKSFDGGEIVKTMAQFDMQDIRDAIKTFEDTVNGDYPKYKLTEKGLEFGRQVTEFK